MTASSEPALLAVHDLSIGFGAGRGPMNPPVVKGVSFTIPPRSVVALVGESGSGKSATAMALMDLLPPSAWLGPASRIAFGGKALLDGAADTRQAQRGRSISMIFQEPMSSLNPVFTVGFQVAEVLRQHLRLDAADARRQAIDLLQQVGIPEPQARFEAYPSQLSGGQQQRVMIAMAIACQPRLLIADEPTTALDVTVQKQIVTLLARLRQERDMAMLFITHDLALVGEIAEHVVVMRQGEVVEAGPVAEVFRRPRHAYTRALLECRPGWRDPQQRPALQLVAGGQRAPAPTLAPAVPLRPAPPWLEVRGLGKSFPVHGGGGWTRRRQTVLSDVSFTLARGRTLGVVGESGSGKSTLGLALLRLHQADAGQVRIDGCDILALPERQFAPYRRRLQIVFQNPYASLNPRFSVEQILTEPMRIHGLEGDAGGRRRQARALLHQVGLPADALGRYPHEFSGGQRQRLAIARCLALRPELLVCDESVSALDVSVQAQVLALLAELQDMHGLSYLFISHDLGVVRQIADEVLVLRQGRVVESGPTETLFRDPREAYTQALLEAIPKGLGG